MSESDDTSEAPRRPRRRIGWLVSLFLFLLIAAATVAGGGIVILNRAYTEPGPLAVDTVLVIPGGASGQRIAELLGEAEVVVDPRIARLAMRLLAPERPLRAGEYAFAARISLKDAIQQLQAGDTVVRRVTIAEGLTTRQALEALAAAEGLEGDVPDLDSVGEGALLPETYHFSLGDSRADLVARMRSLMSETVARLWEARAEGLPIRTPEEAVVLASIIERETAVPAERTKVASVFVNRLNRGMKLQSDPTVAYGVPPGGGQFTGRLLFRHLEADHPHNTYTRTGLPPTPIANPGADAIAAALNPAETEYLYFVADGSGGHAFAKTLAEHNRNVAKWRRIQRERRRAE